MLELNGGDGTANAESAAAASAAADSALKSGASFEAARAIVKENDQACEANDAAVASDSDSTRNFCEKRDESDGDQRHKLHDKRDGV